MLVTFIKFDLVIHEMNLRICFKFWKQVNVVLTDTVNSQYFLNDCQHVVSLRNLKDLKSIYYTDTEMLEFISNKHEVSTSIKIGQSNLWNQRP